MPLRWSMIDSEYGTNSYLSIYKAKEPIIKSDDLFSLATLINVVATVSVKIETRRTYIDASDETD